MLSDASIRKYLASGDISIKPFSELDLRPAGVTLRLGRTLLVPKAGSTANLVTGQVPEYHRRELLDGETYTLEPGAFVLATTFERVGISQRIGMMIDGRSTLGRLGLMVHATSSIFDTGEEPKFLTLELKNIGPSRIVIGPKLLVVRAVFFLLKPAAKARYDAYGRYQKNDEGYPVM